MNQEEHDAQQIQGIKCFSCSTVFNNFRGGKCKEHKYCLRCLRKQKWKCTRCDPISNKNEQDQSQEEVMNQQPVVHIDQDENPEAEKEEVDDSTQLKTFAISKNLNEVESASNKVEGEEISQNLDKGEVKTYNLIQFDNQIISEIHSDKCSNCQKKNQELEDRLQKTQIMQAQLNELKSKNKGLLLKIAKYEEREQQSIQEKAEREAKIAQIMQTNDNYNQKQINEKEQRQQHAQDFNSMKELIKGYHNMLLMHFQEINNNYSYGLALEKMKMVKLLVKNFNSMTIDNSELTHIITQNKNIINNYVLSDIQHFRQEIQNLEINFELFQGNIGTKIKIILQKLALYKEIMDDEAQIQNFENEIASKINNFLKTVVQKNIINNKTLRNEFIIIQYLNEYLKFQENFENQIKIIFNKCSANLTSIKNLLADNFKKIENTYFSLGLDSSQSVKSIHFKPQKIDILIKLIINIRIIMKNEKYRLSFQQETKRKITGFKDKINLKLNEIRSTIKKQIENKEVIYNYNENYRYFIALTKIKDFDGIWEAEENFYHNFKFTELYESVSIRNQVLKKKKIHQIHQIIREEKINFELLNQEMDSIQGNEGMFSVMVCRIQEILTKKLLKLEKLNEFSSMRCDDLQKFKEFYVEVNHLKVTIEQREQFTNHIQLTLYSNVIESKVELLSKFLLERFNYLFQNYNSPEFEQIEKEIKYLISFEVFFKQNFAKKHKSLLKKIKENFKPLKKQEYFFKCLEEVIQEGKTFIANFIRTEAFLEEDYDMIQKFCRSFTSKQNQNINRKIQLNIQGKIQRLHNEEWAKGSFQSDSEKRLNVNIEKLSPNLQMKFKERLQKLHQQALSAMNKRLEEIKMKLNDEGNNYIVEFLALIRKQEERKAVNVEKYFDILRSYHSNLYEKQIKRNKLEQFIEEYIYKLGLKNQKSAKIKKIYQILENKIFTNQNKCMQVLQKEIIKQFEEEQFITKKTMENIEELDQLVNLHSFFLKESDRSLLGPTQKAFVKGFFTKLTQSLRKYLRNLIQIIKAQQLQQGINQESFSIKLIKMKVISNLLIKLSKSTTQREAVEQIVRQYNEKMRNYMNLIQNYSFEDFLSRDQLSDAEILKDMQKTDETFKILTSIQQFCYSNLNLLKNKVVDLHFFELKCEDLASNLEVSWKHFYEMTIKAETNHIFTKDGSISQKFKMFMRIKNILKQKRVKIFNFIANDEYDIKSDLFEQSKRISSETQKLVKECSDEYGKYYIEMKDKTDDIENKQKNQIEEINNSHRGKIKEYKQKIEAINLVMYVEQDEQQAKKQLKELQANLQMEQKLEREQIDDTKSRCAKILSQLHDLWHGKKNNVFKRIIDNVTIIKNVALEFAQEEIKRSLQKYIDKIFEELQRSHQTIKDELLNQFYQKQQSSHSIANIVQQNKIFDDLKALKFIQRSKHYNIEYVIDNCNQIRSQSEAYKQNFLNDYNSYETEVKRIQNYYTAKRTEEALNEIINSTITQANKISNPLLLGRIFGLESILRIKHKSVLKFIRNPHPVQIATILLLIQNQQNGGNFNIRNGMAEVKTGQGKSIVLAGLCCFLALKGYYTYCACYSSYLSQRDRKDYQTLFEKLQIVERVKYGTFAEHCKQILDQSGKFYFKNVITQFLLNSSQKIDSKYHSYLHRLKSIFEKTDSTKRVLIIDEVDVFFEERYFGKFYRPAISLDTQAIKDTIKFIWQHREEGKTKKEQLKTKIKNSNCYKELISTWSHLSQLFENQLEGMICAAVDPSHTHEIIDQKIVYRYDGIIEEQLNSGYKTVFLACSEIERNTISPQFYEKSLKMSLIISQFSYAQLPKYFNNILGVSGTLETLSKSRKDIMREKYNINNFYILPSIYGAPRRTIQTPIVVENDYIKVLVDRICGYSSTGRPVLVFFKNRGNMITYYQDQYVKQKLADCCFLSEDDEQSKRDSLIRLAGRKGRVTFMTSYFSRGTDFILEDKSIIEAGGFHVIQTYISKDESDYVQVYGRTARQGKKGSYQMVLHTQLLTQYNISNNIKRNILFDELRKSWNQRDEVYGHSLKNKILQAQEIHNRSYGIIKSLSIGTASLIREIQKLNYVNVIAAKNIKSVIAIDGTGSMNLVLQNVKEVITRAVVQTQQIIRRKNINASFEQQIMIYRNYSSQNQIYEYSGFTNDPKVLTNWIEPISTSGGQGNEAIEIVYNKINQMQGIDQVILIGDARCNTYDDMIRKRSRISPVAQFWTNMDIPFVNSPEEELQTLISKNIPIHSLYMLKCSQEARNYFIEISNRTNGICWALDVDDHDQSGQKVADFIAQNVLNQIGGQQLVKQYYAMRDG